MPTKVIPRYVQRQEKAKKRLRSQTAHTLVQHKLMMVRNGMAIENLPEADPADTMQLLINRCTLLWRAAAAEVDALEPGLAPNQCDNGHELWASWDDNSNLVVTANFWVEMEKRLRDELKALTESAQRLGLAERRTRVAEGQLQILGEALKRACDKLGLPPEQQRLLGTELRSELAVIEGKAVAA